MAQKRRAPHGACGLKSRHGAWQDEHRSRAPHGACGLKFTSSNGQDHLSLSRPTRGVWIEIAVLLASISNAGVAPHTGRVD